MNVRKIYVYTSVFLTLAIVVMAGYIGKIEIEGEVLDSKGEEITGDEDIVTVLAAITKIDFASWMHVERKTEKERNIEALANVLRSLFKAGNINKETSEQVNESDVNAFTHRDKYYRAINDKINLNRRFFRGEMKIEEWRKIESMVDFKLAATLAHEGKLAMHASKESSAHAEAIAFQKEIDVIDGLLRIAPTIVPADELEGVKKTLQREKEQAEIARDRYDEERKKEKSHHSKPEEPRGVFIRFKFDEIELLIHSGSALITMTHEFLGEFEVRFQKIEYPLSAAKLKLNGKEVLIISGTAFNHSTGIIEVFDFLTRPDDQGRQIITGLAPVSSIIFEARNIWPASVAVAENSNIFILDSFVSRILLLKDSNLVEVANAKRFKEIRNIKAIGFGVLTRLINYPTLLGSDLPHGIGTSTDESRIFAFIDVNSDFVIDDIKTFTIRESITFKPRFFIVPFSREDELFIDATFKSKIKAVTDEGVVLGSIDSVPFESPAKIELVRPLREGEVVKLLDETINEISSPYNVMEPAPTVIDIFPEIGRERIFPTVVILGKYFSPDSNVFVFGFRSQNLVVKDNLIVARIPTFLRVEELNPVSAQIEVRSAIAASTFVDFVYYDEKDYLRALRYQRGAMYKKRKMVMQIMKSLREDPKNSSNPTHEKIELQYIE